MRQRSDGNRDKCAGRAHEQGVTRADSPNPDGLYHRGEPADRKRGKDRPRQVNFTLSRGAYDDGGSQYDTAYNEGRVLETKTEGQAG